MAGISTPDQRVRVFVSSTLGELATERAAARAAIEALHLTPVMFEMGARPHPPRALYRAYLDQSDVFVGIYWERYGWVAPDEAVSGLEDEYRLAAGRMPQLVYIKEPADGREPALRDLLARIQSDDRLSYRRFSTPEDLTAMVTEDLAVLLSERFRPAAGGDPGGALSARTRPDVAPPVPLDRTIGREDDVAEVVRLVRAGHRLVTLTGAGGVGKSRLGVEVARSLAPDFGGRAVFVPLAGLDDASLVLPAVAERLGVRAGAVSDLVAAVADELGERPALLVLDNFEHVTGAAADVADVLARSPSSAAVVTSRHVLRVHGEREHQVAPLPERAAVELFVERAAAARPGLSMNDENRQAVVEIARRLDHLPLAIELAAACMRLYTPTDLLDRLPDRLDVLARGAVDAPERQRTLRATMDWSYGLLNDAERALFARLGVFNGGFGLSAVEAVCARDDEPDVLATLAALVEKSLVVPLDDVSGTEPRLRMLEPVRAYAVEKLGGLPDGVETEARHTAWVIEVLAEQTAARGAQFGAWVARMDQERANVRAVVQRALAARQLGLVAVVARAVIGYLSLRDGEPEVARWVNDALALDDGADPALRARLLLTRGLVDGALARYHEAEAALAEARELVPEGEYDGWDAAIAAMVAAVAASALRPPEQALGLAVRAAEAMADAGIDVGEAYMWLTAGTVALSCDPSCAAEYIRRGIALVEAMGNQGVRGYALVLLGFAARRQGDVDGARRLFVEAAETSRGSGQWTSVAYAVDGLAAAAVDLGLAVDAARALGTTGVARATVDRTPWAAYHPLLADVGDAVDALLPPDVAVAARAEGARWDAAEALDRTLAAVRAATAASADASG